MSLQLQHLSEQRRKEIASLAKKRGRSTHGQMLVEGWRSVKSALFAGALVTEVLVTGEVLKDVEIVDVLKKFTASVRVYELSEKAARQISSVETSQGIFAVAGIKILPLEAFEAMDAIVALDGIQDPGNVGTVIRTAAWFGVGGVIAGAGTADFFNPKVIRASMGGIWDVQVAQVNDLAGRLQVLKAAGLKVICADLEGTPVYSWQPHQRTVLVIGGEANGVSDGVRKVVDEAITITGTEKRRGVESLNAGIAAGIIMHHWAGR